jgi:fermentation-respiration switch protein FrsA (DUF1100 family)
MSTSASIQATKVTFPNQLTSMAGILFVPPNMDKTKKYPALAVAHPFGGVKEQTAGTYARKMAEKGYVTLAFDASHQGESGGYPRDTENPAERMEDIRCAVDYLTTLSIVDEGRIGLLGVCAGGSYVMAVAPTEMRAKAIVSVSLWDLRVTARMALAMGRKSRNRLYAARPPAGSRGDSKWQVWQDFGIPKSRLSSLKSGGREGIRTPGLLVANEALSQLSYSPTSSV